MKLLIAVALFAISNTALTAQSANTKHCEGCRESSVISDGIICPDDKHSVSGSIQNQEQKKTEKRHPSKEEISAQKIAFFTQELNLTPQEAEKFWPVYNASWHARGKARKEIMRNLEKLNKALDENPPVPDAEIEALSDTYIKSFKKEGDLYISYFNDFKKVLPLRKAAKVFSAEEKFRVMLIKQLRGK